MKISFHTNLDWYRGVQWPELTFVPRKGELVQVHSKSMEFCSYNKIPDTLEVVNVTYGEYVSVELWYKKVDTDRAALSEKGLNHLYKQ